MVRNRGAVDFAAFLSYARRDDEHDDGRITLLRRRLEGEVRMQTGKEFSIFQDRKNILVGQQWRDRIEKSINGSTLLVTIITPSFLASQKCRDEVRLFLERERRLDREDLIVPILYVRTQGLNDAEDGVAATLERRQYFSWGHLRFEDYGSSEVRRALAEVASHVVMAIERSSERGGIEIVPEEIPPDDGPGFIEVLAEAEESMPLFNDAIVSIGRVVTEIGDNASLAADEMNSASSTGKPSSAKLSAIYRLKKRLEDPVVEMEDITDEYLDHLARVSGGINVLIDRVPSLEKEEEIQAAQGLLLALEILAKKGREGLEALQGLDQRIVANYPLSSTLRPLFRRLSNALRKIQPSKQEFEAWRHDLAAALETLENG